MPVLKRLTWFCPVFLLFTATCQADEQHLVDHYDPIIEDPQLTLPNLIELTLDKFPEGQIIPAIQQEAEALKERGDSWFAGSANAFFYYLDDRLGANNGAREIEGEIAVPLWNWGQRDAAQELAGHAKQAGDLQTQAIKLQVAGLIRAMLWDIRLQSSHFAMARQIYDVSEKLLNTVARRVELGDLPRADLLLAQSELLENRSELVSAEAEMMHARKRYATLTQMSRMPTDFSEAQNTKDAINLQHPVLLALNAIIERKKAELLWIKAAGSGQATFALGGKSDRGGFDDVSGITGMSVSINVPFGGSAHLAPDIAAANLELSTAVAERDRYYRKLSEMLHEAEHALQVDRAELQIARQRKKIAEAHLKMTQLSFAAGEINLMDLLKIQSRSFAAIQDANENEITLQRDIALYNQAVGVLP